MVMTRYLLSKRCEKVGSTFIVMVLIMIISEWACPVGIKTIYALDDTVILSDFNFEKDKGKWWVYKGELSITKDPKNIKEGLGALEWRYKIRNQKWNLLSRVKIDTTQFKGKQGLVFWIKSDRAAPLLFQFVEKDGTNYQYFNPGKPVELEWRLYEINFDEFIVDKDTPDENNALDLDQIDRLEIVEVAGFFKTLSEGPRTVWIDDVKVVGKEKMTDGHIETEWPVKVTAGVSSVQGKYGKGILIDAEQAKVVFPTRNNLNPDEGTIEMWIKPLYNREERKKTLLSCESPPDLFGRAGNKIQFYLQGGSLTFQVHNSVLSSPVPSREREGFYYVAIGWDYQGAVLYVNGLKVAETKEIKNLGILSKEIVVGNLRNGTAPSQTIIDELRISRVKRSREDIEISSRNSREFARDKDTLFLAHFNEVLLPEIDVRRKDFRRGEKISFELSIPTPVFSREIQDKYTLQFQVLDQYNVVAQGKKVMTLAMGDLSGQKNHAKLEIDSVLKGGKYKLRLKLLAGEDLLNKGEELFSVFPLSEKDEGKASVPPKEIRKEWYNNVQVFGIIPLPVEEAKAFNITVNGAWGGSHTADPVLTKEEFSPAVRKKYKTDSEFVSAMHDNGLLASAGLVAASGNNTSIKQHPELKKAISKTAQGKDVISWLEDSYIMSSSNPIWYNWMIYLGKKAIDAGVELVMFDDVQEFQFPLHGGFDSYSIDEFKKYLRSNFTVTELGSRFRIDDIDNLSVAKRVTDKAGQDYEARIKADPLVGVFARFHEERNFEAKKHIIESLRRYAEKKGKKVAIAANIMALGTTRFDGYWSKGLHFSELVDFFAYESVYSVGGKQVIDMPLPRGKWVAWEKLSGAATKGPAVPLLAAEAVEKLQGKDISNYLYILTAEAYANHGAHMLWYAPSYGLGKQWRKSADAAGFILEHRDLYGKEQSERSSLAVLYLYSEGMKTKTFTYLGLAQALADSNLPFDVVFSGDGYYLRDTLTLQELITYKLILIPSVVDITDRQKEIIKEYIAHGGRAVVFDPFEMNIYQSEGEVSFGKGSVIIIPPVKVKGKPEDSGTAYNLTYDDSIRKDIKKTVNKYVEDEIIINDSDRKIIAYPYHQANAKRMIIHLINYDHNFKNDKVRIKKDIMIKIKKPDFYTERSKAYMISPDFKGRITLPAILRDGYIELKIPELKVYSIVIL